MGELIAVGVALQRAADREPGVEIIQMFRNMTKDVYDATNKYQRPFVYGSTFDNFYFNIK